MADEELLDVVDEWGAPAGVAPRSRVHAEGLWHRCLHLWVLSGSSVLLQRRSAAKQAFPGMLDASAAGHLLAGESVMDGLREAEEELGVAFGPEDVTALGVRASVDRPTPGTVNRELQHVFLARDDRPLEAWTDFDRVEVAGLAALEVDAFVALACTDAPGPWPARAWDGAALTDVALERDELIPGAYLAPLAIMCERALAGVAPLAI